jgi:hypothetical protein
VSARPTPVTLKKLMSGDGWSQSPVGVEEGWGHLLSGC